MAETVTCTECGATMDKVTAGDDRSRAGEPVSWGSWCGDGAPWPGRVCCVPCLRRLDLEHVQATGRLFAYWDDKGRRVTDWLSHPYSVAATVGPAYRVPAFGGYSVRRSVWFTLADGTRWHGTYYESSGDYIRARRLKAA